MRLSLIVLDELGAGPSSRGSKQKPGCGPTKSNQPHFDARISESGFGLKVYRCEQIDESLGRLGRELNANQSMKGRRLQRLMELTYRRGRPSGLVSPQKARWLVM
jgi:hypothetical protein